MKKIFSFLLLILNVLMVNQIASAQSMAKLSKENILHDGYIPFIYEKNTGKTYLLFKQLEQQFIYQSSLTQGIGSNDIGLDRGQLGETRLVVLEDGGNKILLKQLNTSYRAISNNPLEAKSVHQAFADSVIWGFPIIERTENGIWVDASDFLINDIHGVARRLSNMKEGNFKVDKSRSAFYEKNSKVFPFNTELESSVTFKGTKPGKFLRSVTPDPYSFSVRFHHTFAQLPDDQYQSREYHPQSGYYSISYADYATPLGKNLLKRFIPRHRLNKKDPQAPLSEAINPIIYYVDSAAPEPIRSALIDGASWWNQAFEAIGYKNAFQVKVLPANADPMDLRYNVIQWVHRSTRGWSYGASVIDPRTGEIIKGHVSLGSLRVRQDYLIAQALLSPFKQNLSSIEQQNARTTEMSKMALARIRQLAAHEVGHTLGLAHNFSASVDARASVMDYPQPKVLLKNNQLDFSDAYAVGIGRWDKQAIAYGYTDLSLEQDQHEALMAIVQQIKSAGLHYLSDPDARAISTAAPDANLWDNGSNAIKELQRMSAIRKFSLARFGKNAIPLAEPYSSLAEVLVPLYYYTRYQITAVGKTIGGYYYDYAVKTQNDDFKIIMATGTAQNQAIDALLLTLQPEYLELPTPIRSIIPPKAYGYKETRESNKGYTGITFDEISLAEASVNHTLEVLLNPQRLSRLQQQQAIDDSIPGVSIILTKLTDILENNFDGITGEIQKRIIYRIQQTLIKTYTNNKLAPEVKPLILKTLTDYKRWLKWQLWITGKKNSWYAFYQNRIFDISHFLRFPAKKITDNAINMPPGSPI